MFFIGKKVIGKPGCYVVFLQQSLRMKGFYPKWCKWVHEFVSKGSVGIRVNDAIEDNFQTVKGLRQGEPLSPLLF
jgi:hypothetical protein